MRGHLWMIRTYGIRRWRRYCRARREGLVIDYAKYFTLDELAVLGEHAVPAPWERPA